MRSLRMLLLALLLGPALLAPLAAQRPAARIHLKNGKVVEGPVLQANDERVVLRLRGMEVAISAADIERVVPLSADGEPIPPSQDDATAPSPASGEPEPAAADPSAPPPAPGGAASPVPPPSDPTSAAPARVRESLRPAAVGPPSEDAADSHLGRWLDRYIWLVPQSTGHRVSLGAGVLLLLALIVHWSARLAGVESVTFARSLGVAVALFAALLLEVSLGVEHPPVIAGMVVADVLAFYTLARLVMGAGLLAATVMQVCTVLCGMLVVLLIEVMGYVIQQRDGVT